jgi:CTD small phosphatase-like protein 2
MQNINKIEINENELIIFNFESIVTLEEILTYFFNQNMKLKKNNYISFFKIFKFYRIYNSLDLIFIKEKNLINIIQKLFKLELSTILLDEIYTIEINNIKEKNIMIIKDCLILNHQNFLILSLILIEILQFHNMTNLYQNKISKIIYEKLIDYKLNNTNNIENLKDLFLKIDQKNEDIENKIKLILEEKNIKNKQIFELLNKINELTLEKFIKKTIKILGTNEKEISENDNYNSITIKSVKVPFLSQLKNDENYILTITLDLDGTLIYDQNIEVNYEEEEEEEDDEDNKHQKNNDIILRPRLFEFLDILLELKCELIIFTISVKQRADELVNIIEKNKRYFNGRLCREHCALMGAAYVKDISKLGRNLSKTIIIDNDLGCFYLQQENGILIKSFEGKEDDNKLVNLYQILNQIIKSPFNDIRVELDKYRDELNNLVAN